MGRWRTFGLVVVGLAGAGAALAAWRLLDPLERGTARAAYTGSASCATCHALPFTEWQASQHRQAMMPANEQSVRGDFNTADFAGSGSTATFFRRDGGYWVRTEGADGRPTDFPIRYTFGVYPLQQYLIEQPRGRLQALSIAWDGRPREEGGQRWFHLYPDERIDATDELHWTGRQQNWNFMCADCHSTNVHKNYNAATDSFSTAWSEMTVGCEACHGPGSEHVRWAGTPDWRRRWLWESNGLAVSFNERRGVAWRFDPAASHPVRSARRTTAVEEGVCAQCHSRRVQLAEGYVPGARPDDFYATSTLDRDLYFPDGQQREEVYVYGSFLQSRMHAAGVTCSDCHEPHSGKPRLAGNALCTTCHPRTAYDTTAHHRHREGTSAALCTSCHMPTRTYMVVDPRRDHSFRVPRPDVTIATGAPNACNGCHTDRTAEWALAARPVSGTAALRTAEAFLAGEQGPPEAPEALAAVALDTGASAIVRASALARLTELPSQPSLMAAQRLADDPDSMVRRAAVRLLQVAAPADRAGASVPRLSDPSRAVRIEAARVLAPAVASLDAGTRAQFETAAAELVAAERLHADRPEHRTSLGTFYVDLRRYPDAAAEFQAALALNPAYVPAAVNLADVYRLQQDDSAGERVLRDAVSHVPSSADLQYSLGLLLARTGRLPEATSSLQRAHDLAPESTRFLYGYTLALNSGGRSSEAIQLLRTGISQHPRDRDLLYLLASIERDLGRLADAREHAGRLIALVPSDPEARQLAQSLR